MACLTSSPKVKVVSWLRPQQLHEESDLCNRLTFQKWETTKIGKVRDVIGEALGSIRLSWKYESSSLTRAFTINESDPDQDTRRPLLQPVVHGMPDKLTKGQGRELTTTSATVWRKWPMQKAHPSKVGIPKNWIKFAMSLRTPWSRYPPASHCYSFWFMPCLTISPKARSGVDYDICNSAIGRNPFNLPDCFFVVLKFNLCIFISFILSINIWNHETVTLPKLEGIELTFFQTGLNSASSWL